MLASSAGTTEAEQSLPLDMVQVTQQFDACLTALKRGDIKDGTNSESSLLRTCRDFLVATWDYRPASRTGWSNQINHQSLTSDLKGSGLCFRSARLLGDHEKMQHVVSHFASAWMALASDYDKGRIQEFTIRANALAKEVNTAATEASKWETSPGAVFWNANCAGFFGTTRDDIAEAPKAEATFSLDGAQNTLTVSGVIGPGFTTDLIEKLDAHQFARQLALSSVGGTDVEEAMKAGRIIRERGIHTVALGNCESACTMLFVAGKMRFVGREYSDTLAYGRVGFHRMSVFGMPIPDDSELYEKVASYFALMGSRPDMVLDFMKRNDGIAFYYPNLQELCAADILGVALPGVGLGGLISQESNCVRFRFLNKYNNYLRQPE